MPIPPSAENRWTLAVYLLLGDDDIYWEVLFIVLTVLLGDLLPYPTK